jgi:hypothetical protein
MDDAVNVSPTTFTCRVGYAQFTDALNDVSAFRTDGGLGFIVAASGGIIGE